MKKTYKTHFRKFTLIATLVTLVIFIWQVNILINQYKIKAETSNNDGEQQDSNNNEYSVANNDSGTTSTYDDIDNYSENDSDHTIKGAESSSNSQTNEGETTLEEEQETEIPEFVISTNLDQCINNFIEFDLLNKSGFSSIDEQTAITTYKGLCDELIYSKPTNSYEFIYERSSELPAMPYYVEASGIFLLDNYKVTYQ